jgi:hypothetical protein
MFIQSVTICLGKIFLIIGSGLSTNLRPGNSQRSKPQHSKSLVDGYGDSGLDFIAKRNEDSHFLILFSAQQQLLLLCCFFLLL